MKGLPKGLSLIVSTALVACVIVEEAPGTQPSTSATAPTAPESSHVNPRDSLAGFPISVGCYGRSHIRLIGVELLDAPLRLDSPERCCEKCQKRKRCVGWGYRDHVNHCRLYEEVDEIRECDEHDCVAGITQRKERVEKEGNYIGEPLSRFRGLVPRCEEQRRYVSVAAVLSSCGDVQRRCHPANRTIEPHALPSTGCASEMISDMNFGGYDLNDGFKELTLSPEACCRKCMANPKCVAWTRTKPGQCWIKHVVGRGQQINGDVSGIMPRLLDRRCEERVRGRMYDISNPDQRNATQVSSADSCCQLCLSLPHCILWSYLGDDKSCITLSEYEVETEDRPDAISGYIQSVAPKCDPRGQDTVSYEDIAAEYNVACGSILRYGPRTSRPQCRGRGAARKIFNNGINRLMDRLVV